MNGTEFDLGGALQLAVDLVLDFSIDFFAFIVVAGIIAGFAFYFGRDRIVQIIAGAYAAIPLYMAFPYTDTLTTPLLHIGLYLAFVIAGMVAFSGLSAFIAGSGMGLVKLFLLSAITAGMLIAVAIYILPVEQVYSFSPATKALFASQESFFVWLLAPLVGIYIFGRG